MQPFGLPAKTIGITGGGQLGMMIAQAAKPLDINIVIWSEPGDNPAMKFADLALTDVYTDELVFKKFVTNVDAVTTEFENVPVELFERMSRFTHVRPHPQILGIAQHRYKEKQLCWELGLETAPTMEINETTINAPFGKRVTFPGILKTSRFGYDGKGQIPVRDRDELVNAWNNLGRVDCVYESLVDFYCEVSVIVVRDTHDEIAVYGPIRNSHRGGILRESVWPADINKLAEQRALDAAMKIAYSIGLVGILAIEMFVLKDNRILINEMAPRPHNSGHGTIEGCSVSQFENHVRAVAGLPVLEPRMIGPWRMRNLIGDDFYTADKPSRGVYPHLYGKDVVKPGRKMGHITYLT